MREEISGWWQSGVEVINVEMIAMDVQMINIRVLAVGCKGSKYRDGGSGVQREGLQPWTSTRSSWSRTSNTKIIFKREVGVAMIASSQDMIQ